MNVLNSVPDPRFGGPQQRVLSVAKNLRLDGIHTTVLTPTGDDKFADRLGDEDIDCIQLELPRLRSPTKVKENASFLKNYYGARSKVKNLIEEREIDVVHVNGPLNFPVASAAHRSKAALVWHFNDTLTPLLLREISAKLAKRWADNIVVAADAVHDYYFDGATDSTTIYAPVNVEEFDPSSRDSAPPTLRDELGLEDEFILGTVGNVNPIKGHEYLIESLTVHPERTDDVVVVVAGARISSQEDYYQNLEDKITRLGLEDNVHFLGYRSDVPELLAQFDLFVLSSISEACPIVVLEAMAMGCPVVATNVGGIPEQIPNRKYGWTVPPKDPVALSAALRTALSSPPERKQRAERARKRVECIFSLEACTEKHADVYRRVAET